MDLDPFDLQNPLPFGHAAPPRSLSQPKISPGKMDALLRGTALEEAGVADVAPLEAARLPLLLAEVDPAAAELDESVQPL